MAGPTRLVAWVAGFDFAGVGAITEIDHDLTGQFSDLTPLGPLGDIEHEGPLGRVGYTFNEVGHLRSDQASLRKLLADGKPDYPWRSIIGHFGGGVGADCTIATDMRVKKDSMPPDMSDFTKVNIEYFANRPCNVYEEAQFIHGGGVVGDVFVAPYRGQSLDLGVATRVGGVLCIMIDGSDMRWSGYTSFTVTLQQSATGGSGWAPVTGVSLALDPSQRAVQYLDTVSPLNRYVVTDFTWAGQASFQINNQGGYSMGATTILVDGKAANEVIQDADSVTVDGNSHVVATATPVGNNGYRLSIPSGLQSDVRNNDVVTVNHGSERAKFISALQLL